MATKLTQVQIAYLQECSIHGKFNPNHGGLVSIGMLDSDGRTRKSLVKDLLSKGLIEENDGKYYTTSKVYDGIVAEPVNLVEVWKRNRDRRLQSRKNDDFIVVQKDNFTFGESKWLLENKAELQWLVIDAKPYKWMQYDFNTIPGDPTTTNESPWWNADNLEDCMAKSKRAFSQFAGRSHEGFFIAVTNEQLKSFVKDLTFNERIDQLFSQNLPWGLVALNLVSEDEMYEDVPDGETTKKSPLVSSSLYCGFHIVGASLNAGTEPEKWETNLVASMERIKKQIARGQKIIDLLAKIDAAIVKHGGWNKFLADYRALLVDNVRKQDEAAEAA